MHPFTVASPAAARRLLGRDHPAAPRAGLARGMGRMIFPGQAVLLREVPVLQVSAQSRDSPARVDDQPRPPHAPSIGARPSPRGGSGSRCGPSQNSALARPKRLGHLGHLKDSRKRIAGSAPVPGRHGLKPNPDLALDDA
jgi:hypothetical protein